MKLMRIGERGGERPAVWASDTEVWDASPVTGDFGPAFFAGDGVARLRRAVLDGTLPRLPLAGVRIGAPISAPGKLMAIGLNYHDHAREMGSPLPEQPIVFDKATSSICGPYDDVVLPSNYDTVDYEVELAFVIGRAAKRVLANEAMAHVAGYLVCNDISERTAQKKEGGQWYRAKSFDTFAPVGPYLVTADDVPDPHALALTCTVAGELRQNGNTADLIFKLPELIAFLSRNITLHPGDIVTTGTPAGVGMGRTPPGYLKDGQIIEVEVAGLGRQRNALVRESELGGR
jgi:2-keto-4-pentenoate hydratase/2-oxohepta-3-ene-1,7-dioic acid hydratase in catechol pathway